jgi:hypothetical protein
MQKDYLNFYCGLCKKDLCKDHYHNDNNCPFVTKSTSENPNLKFNNKNITSSFTCYFASCKKTVYNSKSYNCKFCNKEFCLEHRLECDHNCENKKLSFKETAQINKNKFKDRLKELKANNK